ncbi:AP-5 complex subunit mu-1-like [Glandiceps talaboti]
MSVRALWIIKLPVGGVAGNVIFARTFPTVEKRAKNLTTSDNHVAVPEGKEFYDAIATELGLNIKSTKFVKSRDTCQKILTQQKPVYEVTTDKGKLWPVVIIEQFGLLFCCLPLVEAGSDKRPALVTLPGVTMGISLLQHVAEFVGPQPHDVDQNSPQLQKLYNYLCYAVPFGTPIDLNISTVKACVQSKPLQSVPPEKQPAWKPVLMKGGKSQVQFAITEHIRAVLYDSHTVSDVWDVYGTVSCKADLEGIPDVTVNLSVAPNHPPLDNLVVHPCVRTADTQQVTGSVPVQGSTPGPRRLRFTPPLENFTLCHYSSSHIPQLPIRGFFQMKGDQKSVKLLVQLKLQENIKNSFDYCELQVPFYNRGHIVNIDTATTTGNVIVGPDQRRIAWNIGQKFPSRSLEVELNGIVYFKDYNPPEKSENTDDPFCVGLNAYAQLFFKISDYTLSGCFVDQKSVQVYPSTKTKLTAVRELIAADYKIWNIHGDSQVAFPPPKSMLS